MTTIITIVVVALVFFVTICVVAFMIWKRETEMRTDSIKAIEYNVEEMLYELTGSSSREIRRGRIKRGEDADKNQGGAQQEINEKRDEVDRSGESDSTRTQDPFGWMRKESSEETGRREENADADVKARENITVFEPAAVPQAPYERRRSGADASRVGRYGLRWTEVSEEKRRETQDAVQESVMTSEADEMPDAIILPETEQMSAMGMMAQSESISEMGMTPEQMPGTGWQGRPGGWAPVSMYAAEFPMMQGNPQQGGDLLENPQIAIQPQTMEMPQMQQAMQPPQPEMLQQMSSLPQQMPQPSPPSQLQPQQSPTPQPQPTDQPQQQREGGMISKLLKRRKKQKEEGQEQQDTRAEGPKQDPLYGWVENYEARNARQTHAAPDETPSEEQIYAPYGNAGHIGDVINHESTGYDGKSYAGSETDVRQMEPEDEWKEKTVEDLLKEYIDEPFGSEDALSSSPAGTGYNVGKSGRKYTVEELETLIKE